MSACKSCGQPIRWHATGSGQRMPLDPDPVPDGSILILPNGIIRVVPVEERAAMVAPLFKTHFQTCPSASVHRGPRGARR